jgi:hypothetical protein
MKKQMIAIAIVAMAALTACGEDRYSVEVGPVATPPPTVQPAPPQVIVIQQPAPVPAPAPTNDNALPLILLGAMGACVVFVTAMLIARIVAQPAPAPRSEPYPPFVQATFQRPQPEPDVPLLNTVNHYHYHAGSEADMPSGWSVARKAEHLLSAGYTVDEARNIIDQQHRAKQLPPAVK